MRIVKLLTLCAWYTFYVEDKSGYTVETATLSNKYMCGCNIAYTRFYRFVKIENVEFIIDWKIEYQMAVKLVVVKLYANGLKSKCINPV